MKKFVKFHFLMLAILVSNLTVSAQHYYTDISTLSPEQIKNIQSAIVPGSLVKVDAAQLSDNVKKNILRGDTTYTFFTPQSLNKACQQGWRYDIDVAYSPISTYEYSTEEAALKTKDAVGINAAAVYNFDSDGLFLGGGMGFKRLSLTYSDSSGKRVDDSYSLPLFARFGVQSAFTEKLSGFIYADLGYQFALDNKQKSTFLFSLGIGVTYGITRIGVSLLTVRPNPDAYFPNYITDDLPSDFDIKPALTIGVSL